MIQVRKVIEHVYEKVLGQGSDAGSQTANSNHEKSDGEKDSEDVTSIAEEKVEILCNDQVSNTIILLALYFMDFISNFIFFFIFCTLIILF